MITFICCYILFVLFHFGWIIHYTRFVHYLGFTFTPYAVLDCSCVYCVCPTHQLVGITFDSGFPLIVGWFGLRWILRFTLVVTHDAYVVRWFVTGQRVLGLGVPVLLPRLNVYVVHLVVAIVAVTLFV